MCVSTSPGGGSPGSACESPRPRMYVVDDDDDDGDGDDDDDNDVDEMREKSSSVCPNERHGETHKTLALRCQNALSRAAHPSWPYNYNNISVSCMH